MVDERMTATHHSHVQIIAIQLSDAHPALNLAISDDLEEKENNSFFPSMKLRSM
jgi:hypothetical protein